MQITSQNVLYINPLMTGFFFIILTINSSNGCFFWRFFLTLLYVNVTNCSNFVDRLCTCRRQLQNYSTLELLLQYRAKYLSEKHGIFWKVLLNLAAISFEGFFLTLLYVNVYITNYFNFVNTLCACRRQLQNYSALELLL